MTPSPTALSTVLDGLDPDEAAATVLPCCASPAWAAAVVAGRPYPDDETLVGVACARVLDLPWEEVRQALAAHPRIGDRPTGAGTEAGWSRTEQGGMATAGDDLRERLHQGNVAYEERFGHIYLVCATGLTPHELLDRLLGRLGNDSVAEQDVVRRELSLITALRLRKLVATEETV